MAMIALPVLPVSEVTLMLGALVILALCSIASVKYRELGFYGAIVAIVIAFLAVTLSKPALIYYTAFVFAIGIINLVSLKKIKSVVEPNSFLNRLYFLHIIGFERRLH